MASTFKYAVLGGSAIALVTLGLSIRHGLTGEPKPSAPAARASASLVASAKEARRAVVIRQWSVGSAFVYEVGSTLSFAQPDNASTLAGDLAVTVVEAGSDTARLRFELRSARPSGAHLHPLPEEELAHAFYATALSDGHFKGFAFRKGVSSGVRAELKALAEALQLVDAPLAETWKAKELDSTGEYQATYQRSGDAIRKSKDRYLRVRDEGGLKPLRDPTMLKVRAQVDFTLARSGWPASALFDQASEVSAGNLRLSAQRKVKAVLARVEQVRDLAALAADEASLVPDAPDVEALADTERRHDENMVEGASFRTILGELRGDDEDAKNLAITRAAALFRLRPEETTKALRAVLHGGLSDDDKQRLLGALGSAGTKEAQGALASVLDEQSASATTRATAAAALGMSENPTVESEDALIAAMVSSDAKVASTATLGAGNLVRRMNAAGGDASAAVEAILAKLAAATTDGERSACLMALGNTGALEALEAVERYLRYESPTVRMAAVFALRFMPGDRVDGEIAIAMRDEDQLVRQAAVGALEFRPIAPVLGVLDEVLRTDPAASVRLGVVSLMKTRRQEEPSVIGSLQWAARNDPSEEVQSAAKSALEQS